MMASFSSSAASVLTKTVRGGAPLATLTRNIRPKPHVPSPCLIKTQFHTPSKYNLKYGCSRGFTTRSGLFSTSSTPTSAEKATATTSTKAGKNGSSLSQPPSASNDQNNVTPDDFKMSFKDLGMNRITRFVVFAVIGVLGTMETIFWCKVLWRWWTGAEEEAG